MLLAGIIEDDGKTADLIYHMLSSMGRKVSINDYKNLQGLNAEKADDYLKTLGKSGIDILLVKVGTDIDIIEESNISFDFILYGDKYSQAKAGEGNNITPALTGFFSLLDQKGIVIVNADNTELISLLKGMKFSTITYGFNSKASMTTSSTGDGVFKDSFICCLQRTIPTTTGSSIEPQEYKIKLSSSDYDAYNVLAAATFAVVNDVDLNCLH